MECYKPIQTDNLVLSQTTLQQKGDFSLYIGCLQVDSNRLECFCHFYSHICQVGHLLLAFRLFKSSRGVNDFYLFSQRFLVWNEVTLGVPVHTLFDEALRVQLFSHSNA